MSFEGADKPTQTRCVTLEYLDELYDLIAAQKETIAEKSREIDRLRGLLAPEARAWARS